MITVTGIHLGGGGSEHDEAALWDQAFTHGQRVSIWPFAMPPGPTRTASVQWLTDTLRTRGDFTIDAWGLQIDDDSTDTDNSAERLHRSDVVAIPAATPSPCCTTCSATTCFPP